MRLVFISDVGEHVDGFAETLRASGEHAVVRRVATSGELDAMPTNEPTPLGIVVWRQSPTAASLEVAKLRRRFGGTYPIMGLVLPDDDVALPHLIEAAVDELLVWPASEALIDARLRLVEQRWQRRTRQAPTRRKRVVTGATRAPVSTPDVATSSLAALLTALPDAVLWVGFDGIVRDYHASGNVRFLVASDDDLVGSAIGELFSPTDAARVSAGLARAHGASREVRVDYTDTDDDHDQRVTIYISRRTDDEALVVVRARAERDVEGYEAAWLQFCEELPMAVALVESNGDVSRANVAFRQLIGATADEPLSERPLASFFTPASWAGEGDLLREVLDGVRRQGELSATLAEGTGRAVDLAFAPVERGADPPAALAVLRPVKRVRGATATGAISQVLHSAGERVYRWDVANDQMVFDDETDGPLQRDAWLDRIAPSDRAMVAEAQAAHLATGAPFSVVYRRETGHGQRVLFDRAAVTELRSDGSITWTGVITDISDDAPRRDVGVAADTLDGAVLLASTIAPRLARNLAELSHAGSQPTPAMLSLLDELRGLAGQRPLVPSYLALDDIVTEAAAACVDALRDGAHFELNIEEQLGTVLADPAAVRRMFQVLVDGASERLSVDGRITVAARRIDRSERDQILPESARGAEYVAFDVRDNGVTIGDASELLFTAAHGRDASNIGLAEAHGLVTQHGGFLHIEPIASGGASTQAWLPLVEHGPRAVPLESASSALGAGERLLVVDDNPVTRHHTARDLRAAGYEVVVSADVEGAMSAFSAGRSFQLVLTSLVVGRSSARALHMQIRALRPDQPFLFTSGYAMSVADHQFLTLGEHAFLPRPFATDRLLATVRATLPSIPAAPHRVAAS